MAKLKTELTSEEIANKIAELDAKIDDSIKNKSMGRRVSPAKTFLNEIKDLIKKAIDNEVSYKQLSKDILEVYNFKVSEQTIRAFAHNTLGIEKKTRGKKVANTDNKKVKVDKNDMSIEEMKKAQEDSADELDNLM